MNKILLSITVAMASITSAFANKANSQSDKKHSLYEKLKKEKVVKIKTSDNSGKTGSGGGYVGPKEIK